MFTAIDFKALLPEIFLLAGSCGLLLYGVFAKRSVARVSFYIAQFILLATTALLFYVWSTWHGHSLTLFSGMMVVDKLSLTLQCLILIAMFFTFWYSKIYNQNNNMAKNEFYMLALLATLGMFFVVASANFVVLFLGLELMSLPVYAMVAMQRSKSRCIEAAMKYFIIGAVASGILLYGISLFFGATHTLSFAHTAHMLTLMPADQQLILYVGLVFIVVGIAFKFGAAPFHAWVPDVYDGAPNSVTLLISAAPKIAAFGLAIRFFAYAAPSLHLEWTHILIVLSLSSIALGNIVAIVQTNIKRMLAYSSIGHMGYLLLGLACGTARGDAASFFYMVTYVLTSLGAFGMILLLSRSGFEANEIDDFAGLNQRQPWLAFMMLLIMFSLAGIPPMVGFIAKLGILEALIQAHSVWLAVVAIIFTIIGVFYYIRVVKVMYFSDSEQAVEKIHCPKNLILAISINGLLVLGLGIFPSQLFLLSHALF